MPLNPADNLLAARCKALAHPARLAIVRALQRVGGDGCYCGDIVRDLPLAQSTVSQHLKILRDAGIITGEIAGPRSCYCLNEPVLAEVAEAMAGFARPGVPALAGAKQWR